MCTMSGQAAVLQAVCPFVHDSTRSLCLFTSFEKYEKIMFVSLQTTHKIRKEVDIESEVETSNSAGQYWRRSTRPHRLSAEGTNIQGLTRKRKRGRRKPECWCRFCETRHSPLKSYLVIAVAKPLIQKSRGCDTSVLVLVQTCGINAPSIGSVSRCTNLQAIGLLFIFNAKPNRARTHKAK